MRDSVLNILIIDDEKISNLILTRYLQSYDRLNIHIEENGKSALQYLTEVKDKKEVPHIIFLDLRMPIMDGFEFMAVYEKEFANILDLYFVVLTSSMNQYDIEKSEHYSFVSNYIQKPITPDTLKKCIEPFE